MSVTLATEDQEWQALREAAQWLDATAFERFFTATAPWAATLARRAVPEHAVEDYLTRLYLTAWRHLLAYDGLTEPRTWLEALAKQLPGAASEPEPQ